MLVWVGVMTLMVFDGMKERDRCFWCWCGMLRTFGDRKSVEEFLWSLIVICDTAIVLP